MKNFLILMTAFAVSIQVTFGVEDTDVDSVITYCQDKIRRIQATEGRYVKAERKLGEPVLIGVTNDELLNITYGIHQRQTVFECIGDMLNEVSEQDLLKSSSYRDLTQKCISERPSIPQCDPSYRYRAINATCNNLFHPRWGSTIGCFRRLFPANYEGVSGMRKSVQGKQLPEPRTVSLKNVKQQTRPTKDYNTLFVLFGQTVVHDVGEFQVTSVEGDHLIECCKYEGTKYQYPACRPLLNRPDDPFYSSRHVTCLDFIRVASCYSCSIDKRIQINVATAYIDCSLVYGTTDNTANFLRSNDGSGKLLTQETKAGELLPPVMSEGNRCTRPQEGPKQKEQYCFVAGDTRVDQHSVLSMFHTLLLREHNRLVEELKILNPRWEEEQLYQEARKILIAEFQIIVYKEYLPLLIGQKLMTKYGLDIGGESNYNSTMNPSLSVEFNAAAFRIHSMIPGKVVDGEEYERLRFLYVNAVPIYEDRLQSFVSKMSDKQGETYDWYMPTDLTDWLYRERYGTYGYDLAALDVQRGRDVGLPTYSQVIEYMENRPGTIKKFDDLKKYLVPECQRHLEQTYSDVQDIDLWIGLNCERIPDDMIISPIAAEIIAEQFQRLKYGDRFFVEHDRKLTDAQRQTLLNASLSKLICENSKVKKIQPMSMLIESSQNTLQDCSAIPGIDLEKWRE